MHLIDWACVAHSRLRLPAAGPKLRTGMAEKRADIAILGGGLAGGLIALALARWRKDVSVLLVDEADRFGGNHVWPFLGSDVSEAGRALLTPLVASGWRGYDVRFPDLSRGFPTAVYAVTSDRLDAVLHRALPASAIMTGARALACSAQAATLVDGTRIAARAVLAARGLRNTTALSGGWQRYLGRRLKLERPHGLVRPILHDGSVDQVNGLRFVTCLPTAADEVHVEDICFGQSPTVPGATLAARIDDYVRAQGWLVREVLGEEHGVRPVVADGDFDTFWRANGGETARAGMRGGLFHPLTGSTLAEAVRYALAVTRQVPVDPAALDGAALARFSRSWAQRYWQRGKFARRLAAMIFAAPGPDRQTRVFEAFYRLDNDLIERMHAGRSTAADLARLFAGRHPLPLGRALGVLTGLGNSGEAGPQPIHGAGSGA
jgi:lycopene beta-cyclase